MGIAQLFAAFRKPKADTARQAEVCDQRQVRLPPNQQPYITQPAPVAAPRSRHAAGLPAVNDVTRQRDRVGLRRTSRVRYPDGRGLTNHRQQMAGAMPQRQPRPSLDLGLQGDLGLRANLNFREDFGGPLMVPESAATKDSEYSANRELGLTCVPKGSLGDRVQYLQSISSGRRTLSPNVPGEVSGDENLYVDITPGGHEYEISGILGSVAQRTRGKRARQPVRQPSPIHEETSLTIPSQESAVTLCGSIASNGEYKIEESIFQNDCTFVRDVGEGGFGKVELHRHKRSKQLLVLKKTRFSSEYINGIPSEMHILRDIIGNRHDRLPRLYHANFSLAEIHCWMDYCDGGDLLDFGEYFIDRGRRVPEGFMWHVLIQLSSALAYLHTGLLDRSRPELEPPKDWQPVVHRDIKPDNIFLKLVPTETHLYPDIVLGDFGLATTRLRTGEDGRSFVGTPCWQPPELPLHSVDSDVWGVGAVVHFLALGTPPLRGKPPYYRLPSGHWECEGVARFVGDVRERGFSRHFQEALGAWLDWEGERRPRGLRGVLRAEGGRLMWLAEGGEQEGLGGFWGWVRRGGGNGGKVIGTGAMGF